MALDETVFITMFIAMETQNALTCTGPSILFAMQGGAVASALAAAVEDMTRQGNVFAADIPLGGKP